MNVERDDVGTMAKPGLVYAFVVNMRDGHQSMTMTISEARKLLKLLPDAIRLADVESDEINPDVWSWR